MRCLGTHATPSSTDRFTRGPSRCSRPPACSPHGTTCRTPTKCCATSGITPSSHNRISRVFHLVVVPPGDWAAFPPSLAGGPTLLQHEPRHHLHQHQHRKL